jgi:hypothetical protein
MAVAVGTHYQQHVDRPLLLFLWSALSEVDLDDLQRAAPDLMRGSRFFPTVADWLEAVDRLPPREVAGLLPPVGTTTGKPDGPPLYCRQCNDTGWIFVAAESVTKCACRPVNPALGAGVRRKLSREREAS